MVETFSKDLVEDFKKLYETKEHYDTIIIVGEEPNVERIYAHFIILCTRSTYFRSALSDKWAERKEGYLVLQKPNINALTFKLILKFLYCGIVDLTNQEYEAILNLLVAADELLIQKLTDFVQDFLIKNNSAFLQQSPIKMLHFIVNNDQFNELKNAYLDILCKTPHLLFDSDKYPSLEKDALKLILKCDNLDMKESDIWKKLVEWGIAQHTMHEGDMICQDTKYDDFDILRETLQELIKLIRFHQMDREAFIPDVWEYVNILPNDLVKDVLRCYLDSNAKPLYQPFLIRWGNFKIDSVSINKEIAQLLTKWIVKKSRNDKISGFQYNFNLLFRSGLDGLSSQTFHRKCDNKGATIVATRIQNSNLLIGGYNPLDWIGKKVWKQTTDSFLFIIDPNDLKKANISRVNHDYSGFAIYCDDNQGPCFGEGPDLQAQNNSTTWRVKPKTYPKFLNMNSHHLTILDYEVFQVVDSITGLSYIWHFLFYIRDHQLVIENVDRN